MVDDHLLVNLRTRLGHAFADAVHDHMALIPETHQVDPRIVAAEVGASAADDVRVQAALADWARAVRS